MQTTQHQKACSSSLTTSCRTTQASYESIQHTAFASTGSSVTPHVLLLHLTYHPYQADSPTKHVCKPVVCVSYAWHSHVDIGVVECAHPLHDGQLHCGGMSWKKHQSTADCLLGGGYPLQPALRSSGALLGVVTPRSCLPLALHLHSCASAHWTR